MSDVPPFQDPAGRRMIPEDLDDAPDAGAELGASTASRISFPSLAPQGGRRVLVTGLGSFWGGRVAQALEADPNVDIIVGLDTTEPTVELERTEFVRVDANYSILARIVKATQVDTIIHTFLIVDPTQMSRRAMHEINVIGTMNLFAAASAATSTKRSWAFGGAGTSSRRGRKSA